LSDRGESALLLASIGASRLQEQVPRVRKLLLDGIIESNEAERMYENNVDDVGLKSKSRSPTAELYLSNELKSYFVYHGLRD